MAHKEQQEYFQRLSISLASHFTAATRVLEVGSQNINGTVRPIFPNAKEYIGVDLGMAPCVDWIIPGELVELPDGWADVTLSTECFEHCRDWQKVFINMIRITKATGLVIVTCAGVGRATHGTLDSDEYSSPFTTSYYKNLSADDIVSRIELGAYFESHGFEVNSVSKDLYFWGIRSGLPISEIDNYWEDPMARLSRAQGQLGQAAARHASLQSELDQVKAEAQQAKVEAVQAKAEADLAKAEADQAKAEAGLAKIEADQAKAEADQAQKEADRIQADAYHAKAQLKSIAESTIWKLTQPIREMKDHLSFRVARFNEQSSTILDTINQNLSNSVDSDIQAIRESGLFDNAYYLAMYPDIQPPPADPIRHYCELGWIEGRNPSDDFDTCGYLDAYADIRNAGLNPFAHFVLAGASESRQATPNSRSWLENDAYFGPLITDIKFIAYYKKPDWDGLMNPHSSQAGTDKHCLPHADLGLYDITRPETLAKQAFMATRHGVCAWCFPLETEHTPKSQDPLSLFLSTPSIDIGFVIDLSLLSNQCHEQIDQHLWRAITDPRYLHIDNRPVIVISLPAEEGDCLTALSRLEHLLSPFKTKKPFLITRCDGSHWQRIVARAPYQVEAALALSIAPCTTTDDGSFKAFDKRGLNYIPYSVVVTQAATMMAEDKNRPYPYYTAVTLGRQGSSSLEKGELMYSNVTIKECRRWLDAAINNVRAKHAYDRRLVFIDSWNDWNNGAVLEPDRQAGYTKLNELSRAIACLPSGLPYPKVTVIVPNYNHARYLSKRLESIYRQTYTNIEVLLLDDASTDNSQELLSEYASRYPEFTTTIFNRENSGSVFRQWARGIKAATGDLIWIAESDDYCSEDFLGTLVRYFDDETVLLAYAKTVFVDENAAVMPGEFAHYVRNLSCSDKWLSSYVVPTHQEAAEAIGIINTIPNSSSAIFRRPIDLPLLDDETWLSMRAAGDWIFYLHLLRGGKIAYSVEATNFFRRYKSSTTHSWNQTDDFFRELSFAVQTAHRLYDLPVSSIEQSRKEFKSFFDTYTGKTDEHFALLFDIESIKEARTLRGPNIAVSTMGFYPGGAEILPILLANEFKRQGQSVILLSGGHGKPEYGVRHMLRNDIPVFETADIATTKEFLIDFGIEVLNSHQWHMQKYPDSVPDVFHSLKAHVASLHGMIEYGNAFGVTLKQLRIADKNITTWVYTADKNLTPFRQHDLFSEDSTRFIKLPNGMPAPRINTVLRAELGIPNDAFVLCCVSRAIPEKGWAETIQAVARAREISDRDIRLILVGNGPVYDEYCSSGVPSFVYLAGFNENSVGFYATSNAGVMLTKFKSESFPLTIIDCLFAGKPFIATSVGEIRNMLTSESGIAGAVVELEDWEVPVGDIAHIIAEFAVNESLYQSAKQLAASVATRYKIEAVALQYLDIFDRDIHRQAA